MRIRYLMLICLMATVWVSCNTETVDTTNEQGQRIRYEKRKKDGAKQGHYQRFHENGTVVEDAYYLNDSLHGERKFFYPNGVVESIEHYERGVLNGKYQKFRENGVLYIEQQFVNGAMEGQSLRYYPNGVLEEKVTIVDNNENGPFLEFYDNGNRKCEGTYAPIGDGDSAEQGELREYDENGQLVRIADCDRGICRTRWKKD